MFSSAAEDWSTFLPPQHTPEVRSQANAPWLAFVVSNCVHLKSSFCRLSEVKNTCVCVCVFEELLLQAFRSKEFLKAFCFL